MAAAHSKTANASQTSKAASWHTNLQTATLFLMLLTGPILPRFNAAFLVLLALLAAADLFVLNRHVVPARKHTAHVFLFAVVAGFVAYLFLNALWARDTGTALGKAALAGFIAGSVFLIGMSFSRQPGKVLERSATAATWGAAIGLGIALFEFSTGHQLQLMLFEIWPAIRSEENAVLIFIDQGDKLVPLAPSEYGKWHENEVIRIHTDGLNRNLSLVLLYLWPILAIAAGIAGSAWRRWIVGGLLCIATLTILVSESQTAQIAMIGGLGVFVLARQWPRFTHWAIAAAWCVALVLTLPLASAPYNAGLHKADWLFESAKDRIAIWSLTSELARQSPLFGVGIRSTRYIGREMRDSPEHAETYGKPRRLGIHAHNHFLQVWFELGAVGAAFVLAWGLLLLSRMRALARTSRPFVYAAFATAALIAAFGWGMWQSWLLVGFGATAVLFQLALNRDTEASPNERSS